MATLTAYLRVATVVVLSCLTNASDFLSQRQQVTKELVEEMLLGELADADSSRIAGIQEELRPLFDSLPKNEHGQVESPVVRYALHRYFIHKHGWSVDGLTHAGSTDQTTSAAIVTDLAPQYIQELLANHLDHAGMQLRDLAVFAATMADLIHAEGISNLHAVFEKLDISTSGAVSENSFRLALRGYLSTTIIGFDAEVTGLQSVGLLESEAKDVYGEYDDLLMWVDDIRLAHKYLHLSRRNPFIVRDGVSFEEIDMLVHELYHKFGTMNNRECMAVRENLVANEYPNTGRVPLSKFYADMENPLRESVDYLRNLGALDEANPQNPTVVIPNYISGPSRCVPFSGYFSVCCPDTCESVLSQIEAAVAEPSAEPHLLADVVSKSPSETQPAPRNISAALLSRLDQIGAYHQGRVPLHGRLFMQWLHHAYPRECPYPHVSGTVNPVSQQEWIERHDEIETVLATDAEMDTHISNQLQSGVKIEDLPWANVEELVFVHATNKSNSLSKSFLRPAMMIIAVLSFALPLARASTLLFGNLPADKVQAHLV